MKTLKSFAIVSLTFVFALSCKSPSGDRARTGDAMDAAQLENYDAYPVALEQSMVEWIGTKPTGQHNGTVKLSDGKIKVSEGNIVGGEFSIDLTSIVVLDITDPEMNGRLLGHLKSADFFEVETYPVANFQITGIRSITGMMQAESGITPTHTITGNLTMKNVTKSVSFDAFIDMSMNQITAKTVRFLIDRTEWGVNYGSNKIFANLKDNFIHDDMALSITLVAQK